MITQRISLFGVATLMSLVSLQAAPAKSKTPAVSRAEVTFVDPEKFTDAADRQRGSDWGRDENLAVLKEHIERKATAYVAEGQKLVVKITDVDLAGEIEPWRGGNLQDVRIVKDIYAPRIELSFQLLDANGKVIKEGARQLSNMAFLMNINMDRNDPRVHEKRLLDDWMRTEFAVKK